MGLAKVNKVAEIQNTAIELLSRREHSREELLGKLKRKHASASEDLIHEVLDELTSKDWQSDLRYAESLIRTRIHAHYGWNYIRQELRQQGVDDGVIQQTMENIAPDWYELAQQAYVKKYRGQPVKDFGDKQKRIAFLTRKGFGFDEINQAID